MPVDLPADGRSTRRRFAIAVAALAVCGLAAAGAIAQTDPFVGEFAGDIDGVPHRLLIYSDSAGNYDGELLAEGVRLPVIGRRYGEHMLGQIGFPDDAFAIRARVQGALLFIERQDAPPLRFFRE